MKKSYQIFVGIDVSKSKLDYCIVKHNDPGKHQFGVISNTAKAIAAFIKQLKKVAAKDAAILFCLENTGVYSMPLCYWLQQSEKDYWVVPALQIKRSKGIARGKTDRLDAKDIAYYAISHLHQLNLSKLPENDFIELRLLLAEREKIVKAINTFNGAKENKNYLPQKVIKAVLEHSQATLLFLQKQLRKIDQLIKAMVDRNPVFKQQDELLQSIPGIGKQTSVILIAYTQSFSLFKNHRQFACFAGVAPFEYSSGSSVRGKTKVSHLANKKIKTALNMAALSAKKYDPQLKQYFEKKIMEGKNKMLVLNAIRCKIISRAFAVINRNSKYVNTMKAVA
jgi:transposase